ncbi:S41 family peptidase [Bacteroides sp. 519]|uniref:S41 family peptidase n=1 Tax=Bacteroides sp. 519 TaxID=2302937 RepID=UPI0013D40324|nr:S41 family peptidase [Bacteroides sp. 519]NDV56593.1 PDZ domain-containing protein [Bacteroides sp. 519]
MKYTKFLLFALLCIFFVACKDNDKKPKDERPETLAWVEDTMKEHYYWEGTTKTPNYFSTPESFFKSLLSKEDGKWYDGKHYPYSYITDLTNKSRGFIQETTYGFEFQTVRFSDGNIGAFILYVLPNSPASKAGLERGDMILKNDGKEIITDDDVYSLYGDGATTFTIYNYDAKTDKFVDERLVDIAAARKVENNPVFYSDVITRGNKKVGYLVYNQFNDGNDEDTVYDDELRSLSSSKFKGVDEFILDLRYNNGGFLTCVQVLCSILGPQSKLGSTLGYLQYKSGKKASFSMNKNMLEIPKKPKGENLNMTTLYVLVSSTSASASEAVINCLRPYMNVVVIGRQTEGKNVASQPYFNDDETWEMHPIVALISNSEGFSDYKNGFEPDYDQGDIFDYDDKGYVSFVDILPLGDPNERLLKVALELIDGTYKGRSVRSVNNAALYKVGPVNSLERKATNGVVINNN